ncbi:MAG: N-acetyltransferase [Thermodesulfobacteria bacterium]|nr:N-acetyltransferase [Thermodesulfobacteriota bacterium]
MKKVQVREVRSAKDRDAFLKVPWKIYADDPAWVPPLLIERRDFLSPRNPYFRHAEARFWLAERDGEPVGRISAQIDRLVLERYGEQGHFGMIEAVDDPEVFSALLETAENWLRSRGMKKVLGPFNLSINQECGLLVKGWESPPSFLMGHARPYYAARLEECGYRKAKDLLAYLMTRQPEVLERVERLIPKGSFTVKTRPINKKRLAAELDLIFEIFNEAWAENWGFVPFTREEYLHLGQSLKYLVSSELIRIAEVEGKAVAFIVVLPNFNELIADLNGRLWPWGWLKLLWRFRFRPPRSARVVLMGVRKEYQQTMQGSLLVVRLIDDIRRVLLARGTQRLELSWILEDNRRMRKLAEALAGPPYKVYRIYEKELS